MFNILIAEDEQLYREGIKKLLSEFHEQFQIFMAKNGVEALDVIHQNHIDGMLLDIRMPLMDGLSLLEQLQKEGCYEIETTVLSGFDEFSYAKRAMQLGVHDYVLKPVEPDEILEIIGRMRQRIELRERQKREEEALKGLVQASRPLIKERFFFDILNNRIDNASFESMRDYLGLKLKHNTFRVALLEIQLGEPNAFFQLSNEEHQTRIVLLEKYLEESIKGQYPFELFRLNTDIFLLLFSFDEGYNPKTVEVMTAEIYEQIKSDIGIVVTMSLGQRVDGIENIRKSYYRALDALSYGGVVKGGVYVITDYIRDVGNNILYFDHDKVNVWLRTEQKEAVLNHIRGVFSMVRTAEEVVNPHEIYIFCVKYLMLLFKIAEEYELDLSIFFSDKQNIFAEFANLKTKEQMETQLLAVSEHVVDALSENQKQRDDAVVIKIKQYIKTHYHEDVKSKTIAGEFAYSANYLGQVFKRETGMSLNSYLKMTRIARAKELLKNTDLKILDIAQQTGFNDQQYFCAVFKTVVGVTPSDYRTI